MKRGKRGVSIIEATLAILVTALGVAGIFGISAQMTNMVGLSREDTRSIEAAQHVMEQVKTFSWVRLGLMEGTSVFDISNNAVFSEVPNASCTVTIEPVTGEIGKLKRITVFVTWESQDGTMVSRTLTSLIARKRRLK